MTQIDDKEIARLLESAISRANPALSRDLWPAMLHRMQQHESGMRWYDWALVASLCGCGFLYPHVVLQLLYQL
ncbi:MAG TPA: hypothetical protein VFL42_09945 [Terriglobales bacterium]|nr:hypothetical protein [Terriglobales bacterium]